MNLENFQRQHKDIYELVSELEGYVVSGKVNTMQAEIAKTINKK